jgi:hypothetical protein
MQVMQAASANPQRHFDSPEALLADPHLTDGEKQSLLAGWSSDINARLEAEAEGMGATDPLTAQREGRLANEAQKVQTALTEARHNRAE